MAKSRLGLRARVSQVAGRRRKKPTSHVERTFEEVKQLVRETGGRLFSSSGSGAGGTKTTAGDRKRRGRQRQAAAKQAGASRIRSGKQRQAAAKKAARKRGVKTS